MSKLILVVLSDVEAILELHGALSQCVVGCYCTLTGGTVFIFIPVTNKVVS